MDAYKYIVQSRIAVLSDNQTMAEIVSLEGAQDIVAQQAYDSVLKRRKRQERNAGTVPEFELDRNVATNVPDPDLSTADTVPKFELDRNVATNVPDPELSTAETEFDLGQKLNTSPPDSELSTVQVKIGSIRRFPSWVSDTDGIVAYAGDNDDPWHEEHELIRWKRQSSTYLYNQFNNTILTVLTNGSSQTSASLYCEFELEVVECLIGSYF
jgi:hypothetical protein